ncbi:MAG TPA: sigma-54 dependent transcriptional regulator [Candidatus Hydrogenedentes bacterium]|nr:sigma-54 dependent transcriptional regulator [Candidatus Hydrogenedentota bacterium]HOS03230.1 sigma-54 dependent transcriptional regulator [Candidatus Hydrogenedentota bacterium]
MAYRVLVVDDEKLIRWSIRERLLQERHDVVEAEDGATANRLLEHTDIDLALLDLRLPDMDGISLLCGMRERFPDMPIIIVTAYSTVDNAIEAMKQGAVDYLTKPFNMDELALAVNRALDERQLRNRLHAQVAQAKTRFGLDQLVGESPQMLAIKELVRKIARSDASTVLILGESGAGKDLLARAIHYESARAANPFTTITCTAIPDSLLESELFGHERGAFTDAHAQKRGLLELAEEGTIFLDEVSDMSPALQAKLLRAIEDKSFKRVGGVHDICVNARIIAATNQNLDLALKSGRFRIDLYYRLSTLPIILPPLRERPGDLPLLVDHFLAVYNREFHRSIGGIQKEAMDRLRGYHWPGNVRELRNVLERAVLLASGDRLVENDILLGHLTMPGSHEPEGRLVRLPEKGCNLAEVEKDLVLQALGRTHGNQTQAATLLGLSRDQVRYRMDKFGLLG